MNIVKVPISDVKVWDKNPRNIKTKDMERLKKQIQELGVYKPLICVKENGGYVTLGGNMRLRALKDLKIPKVDISVVKAESEAKRIKYALSDNDRAGEYVEDELAELVYPYIDDINLDDYKLDIGEPISLKDVVDAIAPELPDPSKQEEPELDSERFIEIYCSSQDLKDFQDTLDIWSEKDGVTINIS